MRRASHALWAEGRRRQRCSREARSSCSSCSCCENAWKCCQCRCEPLRVGTQLHPCLQQPLQSPPRPARAAYPFPSCFGERSNAHQLFVARVYLYLCTGCMRTDGGSWVPFTSSPTRRSMTTSAAWLARPFWRAPDEANARRRRSRPSRCSASSWSAAACAARARGTRRRRGAAGGRVAAMARGWASERAAGSA